MNNFENELSALINRYGEENGSDTPDFILAAFLRRSLTAWNESIAERERFYGREIGETNLITIDPRAGASDE